MSATPEYVTPAASETVVQGTVVESPAKPTRTRTQWNSKAACALHLFNLLIFLSICLFTFLFERDAILATNNNDCEYLYNIYWWYGVGIGSLGILGALIGFLSLCPLSTGGRKVFHYMGWTISFFFYLVALGVGIWWSVEQQDGNLLYDVLNYGNDDWKAFCIISQGFQWPAVENTLFNAQKWNGIYLIITGAVGIVWCFALVCFVHKKVRD